jgi:hypothetical protein
MARSASGQAPGFSLPRAGFDSPSRCHSLVAQWWSRPLLRARLLVRVQPGEPRRSRPASEPPLETADALAGVVGSNPTSSARAAAHLVGETALMKRPRRVRSPRGARRACPCSSTEERLVHTEEAGGSTPLAGTVTVVYRMCTLDCGSRGRGFNSPRPPQGARRRWRVGAACKAVA